MIKAIKTFLIISLFGMMISCSNTDITTKEEPLTTENSTTEILTTNNETTTEIPNTNNQTTNQTTIISTTEVETTNEPVTNEPTTEEPTTQSPTSTEETTQAPTTQAPSTTEETTIEMVTIYFENVSSATSTNTLSSIPGNAFTMPDDPIWPGYIFEGWFENQDLTIPFNTSVYPNEDMTVYAKWTEEVTAIDELTQVLENDFNFTCSNNICLFEEGSWTTYTFDLNTLTFTKELLDDDTSGDEQTKTETVVIDEDWSVEYNISITYLSTQNASMRVTGNGLSGSYTVRSFSSNYKSEDEMFVKAKQFIDGDYGSGLVGLIELALSNAGLTMEDLK